MPRIPRLPHLRFGFVVLALLGMNACDPVAYLDGTPPPDAKLKVSAMVVDTVVDPLQGRKVRIRFRSEWSIDSAEFSKHRFVFGMEYSAHDDRWQPTPRAIPISNAQDSRSDTISCTSADCGLTVSVAHVLMLLSNGQYLSVADDSLNRSKLVAP